jgi:hypothetical protein
VTGLLFLLRLGSGPFVEPEQPARRYPADGVWQEAHMLRVLGWVIGIIFLIGLLVVIGVFDLIF